MSKPGVLESMSYYILLALAEGRMHGLDIQSQVLGDSVGAAYLRTSTLYAALKRLDKSALIRVVNADNYHTSYELTESGKRRLEAEARAYERTAQLARKRLGWRP